MAAMLAALAPGVLRSSRFVSHGQVAAWLRAANSLRHIRRPPSTLRRRPGPPPRSSIAWAAGLNAAATPRMNAALPTQQAIVFASSNRRPPQPTLAPRFISKCFPLPVLLRALVSNNARRALPPQPSPPDAGWFPSALSCGERAIARLPANGPSRELSVWVTIWPRPRGNPPSLDEVPGGSTPSIRTAAPCCGARASLAHEVAAGHGPPGRRGISACARREPCLLKKLLAGPAQWRQARLIGALWPQLDRRQPGDPGALPHRRLGRARPGARRRVRPPALCGVAPSLPPGRQGPSRPSPSPRARRLSSSARFTPDAPGGARSCEPQAEGLFAACPACRPGSLSALLRRRRVDFEPTGPTTLLVTAALSPRKTVEAALSRDGVAATPAGPYPGV